MNAFVRTLAILVSAATLWGCSGQPPKDDAAQGGAAGGTETQGQQTTTPRAGTGSGVDVGRVDRGTGYQGDPLNEPGSLLSKRTVYFDFDKSNIKPEARAIIEAHAKYLAENPNKRVTVEGHCDERGTREYNLALGERRSKAVHQMMSLLGVSARQIEVVSYGEERPVDLGHNETAWAKNRRAELIYR